MLQAPLALEAIQSPRFRKIVENTFAADAALDPDRFAAGLTEDGSFVLGGHPPVVGRAAVRRMLVETFGAFSTVRHQLRSVVEGADILAYEAEVTYHFKTGAVQSLPYCNVLHFRGQLVADYRVYLDLSAMNGGGR